MLGEIAIVSDLQSMGYNECELQVGYSMMMLSIGMNANMVQSMEAIIGVRRALHMDRGVFKIIMWKER